MEVVCLILGPTLASCVITIPTLSTCFLGFDVPTLAIRESMLAFRKTSVFILFRGTSFIGGSLMETKLLHGRKYYNWSCIRGIWRHTSCILVMG